MSPTRDPAGPRSTERPMVAGDITPDLTPPAGAGRPLILVVDDDPDVVDLVTDVLSGNGYQTATAGDGEQVDELARRHRPALILLDVLMPNVDGYTTLIRLSGDPQTLNIPVVTITGQGAPVYRTLSAGVGARAHLSKPFSARQLLGTVRAILEDDIRRRP